MPTCRLLPTCCAAGPEHMAADDVLLESAVRGQASLRFYTWSEPTVSLGYFQPHLERARIALARLPWVRRPTGGATLVHHHEVTYALALPPGGDWQPVGVSWIERFHGILQRTLGRFGIAADICQTEEKRGAVLCFLHHTPGDLLVRGHKVAGSAQRKRHGALLQHGGVLLRQSPHTPQLPGLEDLSGITIVQATLIETLRETLTTETGWAVNAGEWTDEEHRAAERLKETRYTAVGWNEKR